MRLARFSSTPIPFFLAMTIDELLRWDKSAARVIEEDNKA